MSPLLRTPTLVRPSLARFTNREAEQQLLRRLLDLPAGQPLPVVVFSGGEGVGKSWLLRKLRADLPDGLPSALLDFQPQPGESLYPADPARSLAELRRQFSNLACPRFDLAYGCLRFRQGVKDESFLNGRELARAAAAALADLWAGEAPDLRSLTPFLERVTAHLDQADDGGGLNRWLTAEAHRQELLRLLQLAPEEIYPQLAGRLVRDLDGGLPERPGRACRGVIFLDSFEVFRSGACGSPTHQHEQWLHELHHPASSALLVIAGREPLPAGASALEGSGRSLRIHPLGGFSEQAARAVLESAGAADPALCDRLLHVSSAPPGNGSRGAPTYHPFLLGLCAEILGNTPGADPSQLDLTPGDLDRLANRFVESLSSPAAATWLRRLALTPRFDETAARAAFPADGAAAPGCPREYPAAAPGCPRSFLAAEPRADLFGSVAPSGRGADLFGGGAPSGRGAAWEALRGFRFLEETAEPGWRTFHPRMRQALVVPDHHNAVDDHQFWHDHWCRRAQTPLDACSALAWYHAYYLNRGRAQAQWEKLAQECRAARRMADHYWLLSWWDFIDREVPKASSLETADALVQRAIEFCYATLGMRSENLRRAIAGFENALDVFSETVFPEPWAEIRNDLGNAYLELEAGNRSENLRRAIACFESALRVFGEARTPARWADIRNKLGVAYADLLSGDRGENLRKAIACHEAALRVYTEAEYPTKWAEIRNNLGAAYTELPLGDRADNLRRAALCYESALRVLAETGNLAEWASAQNNLGNVYEELPQGDRGDNLRKAITCYEAALGVRTEAEHPSHWALIQHNLGNAYERLPVGDRGENLRRAIACYEAALRVHTEAEHPSQWAATLNNLGAAYTDLPSGDRDANLRRAIACNEAALRVRTEADYPAQWASTQNNLGITYSELESGNQADNLRKAIACYEAALRVRTETDYPAQWASTQNNLGNAYENLSSGNRADNLRKAIACYEAALRVFTEANAPLDWSMIQGNLGLALAELADLTGEERLGRRAVPCFEAARRGFAACGFRDEADTMGQYAEETREQFA